jgi:homocysteine S-methyltransferase
MSRYRNNLPQLTGEIFLADGGIETDLIFNHGIEIREFAAHTLLTDAGDREAVADYFRGFLALAGESGAGFILDGQTWKAHLHWAGDLGVDENHLRAANEASIEFISGLRDEFSSNAKPIVLNGIVGPSGDSYAPEAEVAAHDAEDYHARQIGWLAKTEVDMVTATTFTQSDEAIGFVRAARAAGPGQALAEAIEAVDDATGSAAAYFMVNCAHPDHFFHVLEGSDWTRRIRGVRCNASRLSHAELDVCETLDDGDPVELGGQYVELRRRMPWLNIFGGCCGSDLRHITEIARALSD